MNPPSSISGRKPVPITRVSPNIDSRSPAAAPIAMPRCASIHPIALPYRSSSPASSSRRRATGRNRAATREPLRYDGRNQRHRQHERDQHRDRQRGGERAEELAYHAGEETEGGEHHDGREGGTRNRAEDLVGPLPDDLGDGLVRMEGESPLDILDNHDGIVDDDSDGDREAAQAHQVERSPASAMPRRVMTTVSGRDSAAASVVRHSPRKRSSTSTARSRPSAWRRERHASTRGPVPPDRRQARSGRPRGAAGGWSRPPLVPQPGDGGYYLGLPGHVDERCGTAIAGHYLEKILGTIADAAEVAHAYGAIADTMHDDLPTASGELVNPETMMAYCL